MAAMRSTDCNDFGPLLSSQLYHYSELEKVVKTQNPIVYSPGCMYIGAGQIHLRQAEKNSPWFPIFFNDFTAAIIYLNGRNVIIAHRNPFLVIKESYEIVGRLSDVCSHIAHDISYAVLRVDLFCRSGSPEGDHVRKSQSLTSSHGNRFSGSWSLVPCT
ncbi:uncharacterized protein RSE6_03091 [Rhynchosporium secalis]|uniref:Uncharacterized protein n=1 Tax=Rhynchosporium secalis TaxID=38038 RepID=A0A1E1M1W5_RHYSE|nr:uncharacterized protein RSE6_03091 [Rhynchosporium secalis]